jgi:hypothetical protein
MQTAQRLAARHGTETARSEQLTARHGTTRLAASTLTRVSRIIRGNQRCASARALCGIDGGIYPLEDSSGVYPLDGSGGIYPLDQSSGVYSLDGSSNIYPLACSAVGSRCEVYSLDGSGVYSLDGSVTAATATRLAQYLRADE